jgi:hypothetical protein
LKSVSLAANLFLQFSLPFCWRSLRWLRLFHSAAPAQAAGVLRVLKIPDAAGTTVGTQVTDRNGPGFRPAVSVCCAGTVLTVAIRLWQKPDLLNGGIERLVRQRIQASTRLCDVATESNRWFLPATMRMITVLICLLVPGIVPFSENKYVPRRTDNQD